MSNLSRWVLISIIFAFVITLAACQPAANPPTESGPEPDEIVEIFYDWYIAYPGHVLNEREYHARAELSSEFVAYLDELLKEPLVFDPILCAQEKPEGVKVESVDLDNDTAIAHISTPWKTNFDVILSKTSTGWQITGVNCQF